MRRAAGSQVGWGAWLPGPQSAGGQWVATADEAWMTATSRRRHSLRALGMLDGHGNGLAQQPPRRAPQRGPTLNDDLLH